MCEERGEERWVEFSLLCEAEGTGCIWQMLAFRHSEILCLLGVGLIVSVPEQEPRLLLCEAALLAPRMAQALALEQLTQIKVPSHLCSWVKM